MPTFSRRFVYLLFISVFSIYSDRCCKAGYILSGELFHNTRFLINDGPGERDPEDTYAAGDFTKSFTQLKLELDRNDEEGFNLHGEIWGTENHLSENAPTLSTTNYLNDPFLLREVYVGYKYNTFQVNIGKMILNWGRTDKINPIDVINPEDVSEFYMLDKMDRKMSVFLINTNFHMGNYSLETAFIPFFEPGIVAFSGPWVQKELLTLKHLLPGAWSKVNFKPVGMDNISDSETAIRLTGLINAFDFGLVFFSGYHDFPAIKLASDDHGQISIDAKYHRYKGYGYDFFYSFSGYGLRGELFYRDHAYYPALSKTIVLYNERVPDLQVMMGIDKIYGENLYINTQLFYQAICQYKKEIVSDRKIFIGMLMIEDKFFYEDLKLSVEISYDFNEEDGMMNPYGEYRFTYNLKTEAGAFIFFGPNQSYFGQFDKNDSVYFKITYSF